MEPKGVFSHSHSAKCGEPNQRSFSLTVPSYGRFRANWGILNFAGGEATGVPGEILGYHVAWLQFGRLPWKRLFEPTISFCRRGFTVGRAMAQRIQYLLDKMEFSPSLRSEHVTS